MAESTKLRSAVRLGGLKTAIGVDPYRSEFASVFEAIVNFGPTGRRRLLKACTSILRDADLARTEPLRVAATKLLVGLTPDSNKRIKALIREFSRPQSLEVHFTLFCFLDQVLDLSSGKALVEEIPGLIEWYLMNVRSEVAQAAWMAGELLGEHWSIDTALAVLSRAALRARYVAGRKGALHGLGHIISREGVSKGARRQAEQVLKDASEQDKGVTARQYAKQILAGRHA